MILIQDCQIDMLMFSPTTKFSTPTKLVMLGLVLRRLNRTFLWQVGCFGDGQKQTCDMLLLHEVKRITMYYQTLLGEYSVCQSYVKVMHDKSKL